MTNVDRPTRAETQAVTRAELIEAAASVFARRGFQAARVEEIAEEAGYSHGAVYSNFAGKEELFLAVFEQYMSERIEEVAGATEVEGTFAQRAQAAADQWMQRFSDDRATFLLHLEFMIHAARTPHLSAQLGQRMAALRLEIEQRLIDREAQRKVPLPLPPAELALIVRALGIGLAVEALNQPGELDTRLYGNFVALIAMLLETTPQAGAS
ncbi:MAG TPA: TetR/AcrR family transcriptional regulator [Solirubrobacteraceae bacterium]|jgi:AcrR family transcriptional regulator|nr:TetR/AcrR family transcriptional regulator [Solirubrobacteraceae bacterium]